MPRLHPSQSGRNNGSEQFFGPPKRYKWVYKPQEYYPRCQPWCWNIYLHHWVIFGVNVGKYSSTIEHLGIVVSTINHSYWSYVHQLNAIVWGGPRLVGSMIEFCG